MKFLYKRFAKYYDLIYAGKSYAEETRFLSGLIKKHKIRGKDLLEIGCGTGNHAISLKSKGFKITGIDLNKEMLAVARKKTKSITFRQGDMRTFRLKKRFDIILCLFSTIHYNLSYMDLEKTLRNFYDHLEEGGMLIFDMGFNDERWDEDKSRHLCDCSDDEVDLIRFSKSTRKGNHGFLNMAYILRKDNKFHFGEEMHKLRIFRTPQVKKTLERIGFKAQLFEGYSNRSWKKSSKNYVVCAALK